MSGGGDDRAVAVEAHTRSAEDTRAFAAALAPALRPGDVLLLVGELGAGKTTFAQGLARGLGVRDPVTSPTFTLVRPYPCGPGVAVRTMLHADLYRVERLREVSDLALGEMVEDGAVAVVEWGDVGASVLGSDALVARLTVPADDADDTDADDAGGEPVGEPTAEARLITVELPPPRAGLAPELRARLAGWTRPGEG